MNTMTIGRHAVRFAESCARDRISKFQPCLPARLEAEYLAGILTSEHDAQAALAPAVESS